MDDSRYRAVTVTGRREFELVERERREPTAGEVRIAVEACGICHTDALSVEGNRADPAVPIVPGHEIIGRIEAVGAGVAGWAVGERVGVGFLGGQDNTCEQCRRGDFVNCTDQPVTGTSVDGGYAEVAYARATGLVRIPAGLDPLDGAPLLCAGLTMYNALQSARPDGSLVAVQGVGGLGHLGIQYARQLGHRVVAIARGDRKALVAAELGADEYVDSTVSEPAVELRKLGGASMIIATASGGGAISGLIAGLAPRGELVVVGADPEPMRIAATDLIFGGRVVRGSLTGSTIENEDNLAFAMGRSIRSYNEVCPLSEAARGYQRMITGEARFRVVLDTKG